MRIPSKERAAWLDAGVFHDALKDAPDDELRALVGDVAVRAADASRSRGGRVPRAKRRASPTACSMPCAITPSDSWTGIARDARCTWRTFSSRAENSRSAIARFSPRRCRTISTASFVRSCARDSSGRCTKATRSFPRPSSSGTRCGEAMASSSPVLVVADRRRSAPRRDARIGDHRARGAAGAVRAQPKFVAPGGRAHSRAGAERRRRRAGSRGARRCCCAIAASTSSKTGTMPQRATRRSCSISRAIPSGRDRVAQIFAPARVEARARHVTLPGYRRRHRRDVAPAGPAVLPVAGHTPRRCRCRGSFAPRPRRLLARSSRANSRMRSAASA